MSEMDENTRAELWDDMIEEWHNSSSTRPLYKYLGVSAQDYVTWFNHRLPERLKVPPSFKPVGRAKDGYVLTEQRLEELAAEAERGYDVSKLKPRRTT